MKLTIEGIIVLIIVLVITCPIALIWAIEQLWACHIELTLRNWFAALLIIALLKGSTSGGSKS